MMKRTLQRFHSSPLSKYLLAGMEQSGISAPPRLTYLPGRNSLLRFLRNFSSSDPGSEAYTKILPNPGGPVGIIKALRGEGKGGYLAFAVGPERGWTGGEVEEFRGGGWREVGMGGECIRAENAAEGETKIKMNLINTSSGAPLTLTGTLKRSWSPNGYDHFLNLISSSYYVNSPIFRVIPGFIAQFGLNPDPKETEKYKRSIQDDPKGAGPGNKKFTLTFATAGPNTRTTQIFINYNDNLFLDNQGFTPFGYLDSFAVEEIYNGYGEGAPRGKGPDQNAMRFKGEEYMKSFPKMTRIQSIEVVP
ncbi:hypothetical protein TrRE_jg3163 [Triparma retinervis]|uniref:PPIase cyclophilin-type domain-containing protein n=1 Tax=Triparma retinervis TaxID=2557542 RepID=A0A9W7CGR0_9STRA|nr:hypothetical protein TrRE_jg3163 [Triparma retinervis]